MKRLLSALLTLSLCIGLLSGIVLPAGASCVAHNWTFNGSQNGDSIYRCTFCGKKTVQNGAPVNDRYDCCPICGKRYTGPGNGTGYECCDIWWPGCSVCENKNAKIIFQYNVSTSYSSVWKCNRCNELTVIRLDPYPLSAFRDLAPEDWYIQNGAVQYAYWNGLFSGITICEFGPLVRMDRAMFVTVLGRMHGVSANNSAKTKFTDVKKDYYAGYVKWASDRGIVTGTSKTKFSPHAKISRQDICTILYRYANYYGIRLQTINAKRNFKDGKKIDSYARAAVTACQRAGIITGEKSGNGYVFRPRDTANRAEVATIMMKFATA